MKRTLGLGTGRINNRNVTVGGLRVWKRKRRTPKGKRTVPIFYVTFINQSGKRVSRSTGQRLRTSAIPRAEILAQDKQLILFPQPLPAQQTLLAI